VKGFGAGGRGAAATYLKSLEEVDPDRVCVLGTSFGGNAVLPTITAYPSAFAQRWISPALAT